MDFRRNTFFFWYQKDRNLRLQLIIYYIASTRSFLFNDQLSHDRFTRGIINITLIGIANTIAETISVNNGTSLRADNCDFVTSC